MKTFFGGIFIDKDKLIQNGIKYPIKIEYYKTVNGTNETIEQYGVTVVKTEYINKKVKVEKNEIKNITKDEKEIENILKLLKENEVTPVGCNDVIEDLFK